ncbi:MAG: helix-turn-helix domain-containing protein [Pirellula sp.]
MTHCKKQLVSAYPITYSEYAFDAPASESVLSGWSFQVDASFEGSYSHRVLPDGCVSIAYRMGQSERERALIVSGPRIHAMQMDVCAGDSFWGMRFWPDVGGVILGSDPMMLRDRNSLLSAFLKDEASLLEAQLKNCRDYREAQVVFQSFTIQRLVQCPPIDIGVRQCLIAINQSNGSQPVHELAIQLRLGIRQLQRRFRSRVGLTIKEYARIRRIRTALANAIEPSPKDWASVAANSGFSDQAHLSREATALTGLPPAGFQSYIRHIRHHNVDP